MKKFILITFILQTFLVVTPALHAQKTAVTTGIAEFNIGNYELALEKINMALSSGIVLKDYTEAKAWFYKGKSLIALLGEAAQQNNTVLLEKYQNAYLDAYDAFLKASEKDTKGKYQDQIEQSMHGIYNALLQFGMNFLQSGDYGSALDYMNASVSANENFIKRDIYLAYDLRGQSHLNLGDSTQANLDFNNCIAHYNKAKPEVPDLYIGYAFYRLALLFRYKDDNINAALESIQDGKALVNSEHERFKAMKDQFSTDQFTQVQQQYANTSGDLEAFELDIYLNYPDKYAEALVKFQTAISKNPNNTTIHLAYASLLEKSDEEAALKEYNKVLEKDPVNFNAAFNAGALHINEAARISKTMLEAETIEEELKFDEDIKAAMQRALPYMKKAHEIDPTNHEVLRALKQITIQLNMEDEYMHYKKLESEL